MDRDQKNQQKKAPSAMFSLGVVREAYHQITDNQRTEIEDKLKPQLAKEDSSSIAEEVAITIATVAVMGATGVIGEAIAVGAAGYVGEFMAVGIVDAAKSLVPSLKGKTNKNDPSPQTAQAAPGSEPGECTPVVDGGSPDQTASAIASAIAGAGKAAIASTSPSSLATPVDSFIATQAVEINNAATAMSNALDCQFQAADASGHADEIMAAVAKAAQAQVSSAGAIQLEHSLQEWTHSQEGGGEGAGTEEPGTISVLVNIAGYDLNSMIIESAHWDGLNNATNSLAGQDLKQIPVVELLGNGALAVEVKMNGETFTIQKPAGSSSAVFPPGLPRLLLANVGLKEQGADVDEDWAELGNNPQLDELAEAGANSIVYLLYPHTAGELGLGKE